MNEKLKYKWNFFKAGGGYQASIKTGEDIANIASLDQKLWAVLACPTTGIHYNQKTLNFIDANKDRRIRRLELIAAAEWACALLKNPDDITGGSEVLLLSQINDATPEGASLLEAAKMVHTVLGRKENEGLTPRDFDDPSKIFANTLFNADDIIIADAAPEADVKNAIAQIISVVGESADRSGKTGLASAAIADFFGRLEAYKKWQSARLPELSVFEGKTDEFFAKFLAVKNKIDEFFEYVKIVKFDESAAASINANGDIFTKILAGENARAQLAALPLALVSKDEFLNLDSGINPAWEAEISAFKDAVAAKFLDAKSSLSLDAWQKIKDAFAPFGAWLNTKDDRGISALSPEAFALLSDTKIKDKIYALVGKEKEVAGEVAGIISLEKLVHMNAYLYELILNFVNLKSFYSLDGKAIFQMGTLFFNESQCELCIYVDNEGKHATLSGMSYIYLAYCTCTRKDEAPFSIAVAVTAGQPDNIFVGKNGVFYDHQGKDWDATVTKIVANPISIKEAFWSPYKRFAAWVGDMIAKRAAAADASVGGKLQTEVQDIETANKAAPAAATTAAAAPKKIDVGTLAAIGVAFGALTAAFSVITVQLAKLELWQLPILLVLAILLISLPSMVLAAMKLRRRNIGPLLDANSWAINTQAKISFKLGSYLTTNAKLPFGAKHSPDLWENRPRYARNFFAAVLIGALIVAGIEYKTSFIRKRFQKDAPVSQTTNTDADAISPSPAAEAPAAR